MLSDRYGFFFVNIVYYADEFFASPSTENSSFRQYGIDIGNKFF